MNILRSSPRLLRTLTARGNAAVALEERCSWLAVAALGASLAGLAACSAGGGEDGSDDSTVGMFATPGGSNPGAGGSAGASNPAASNNPNPGATQPQGNGGSNGEAPNVNNVSPPNGQMPNGQMPNPGAAGSGNAPGAGGAGGAGGPQGAAGSSPNNPPPGGGFTSVDVNGGASAAFVCPEGMSFGNPLTGMGAVQQVMAPAGSFFAFIEGPVWVGSLNRLFFSDNASGPERIWQISAPFTTPSIFMPNSGSNGLAIDTQDQLLLADQAQRRVTIVGTNNAQVTSTLVPAGNHTPNDLVMRSDRNLYFTDPNSGGRGLYRAAPGGALTGPITQANGMNIPNSPNGVVLSPDENTLYVGDVGAQFVAAFALSPDGAIDTASARTFARTRNNTVDGMAVDCAGNVYAGTQGGVEVYSPNGDFIGTVPTGESSNATFGGADRRTLFVTSRAVLKFVTLAVPGLPD